MFGKERCHQHPARNGPQTAQIVGIDIDEIRPSFPADEGNGIALDDQQRAVDIDDGSVPAEPRSYDDRFVSRRERRQKRTQELEWQFSNWQYWFGHGLA